MATEIVPTYSISGKLCELIHGARQRVVIVSPYLKIWGHVEDALRAAAKRRIEINLFFRADKAAEYKQSIPQWHSLGARVYTVNNLHAKVYSSESASLLTSMNLYDSSAQNSEEFALLTTEPELVRGSLGYADMLLGKASEIKAPSKAAVFLKSAAGIAANAVGNAVSEVLDRVAPLPGHCIRCGKEIDFNLDRPMCDGCYGSWSKYKSRDYAEKYCHDCGGQKATSFAKPQCPTCWKKSK